VIISRSIRTQIAAIGIVLVAFFLASPTLVGADRDSISPIILGTSGVKPSSGPSGQVGATPGTFGLTNPSALVARTPIRIDGNSQWTTANGVRSGTGTQSNPYIIENWLIDMTGRSESAGIRVKGNSTVYGIIRNVKIMNAGGTGQFFGILLGSSDYPPPYNGDRADNVVVTRTEVHSSVYGIEASYGTNNDTLSYNAVFLNVTSRDWQYGITCQGGTFYCSIVGNYIDARNAETGTPTWRTVGIQLGDQRSKDAFPNDALHWRDGAYQVAKYNTVTNATGHGVISDTTYKAQIFGNLVYQNYPGRKDIAGWTSRGVMVENFANYTQVHDNDLSKYKHAIEAGAWSGWYYSNSVHDSDWGVYLNENGSFNVVRFTDFNVIWNTKYFSNSAGNFNIPTGGAPSTNEYTTLLDVYDGPTKTYFPITFTNQASRTISRVWYIWSGTSLNVSYILNAKGGYQPAVTIYNIATSSVTQNFYCTWYGSTVTVTMTRFEPANITWSATYAGIAQVTCSLLSPDVYYHVKRNWVIEQDIFTGSKGILSATLQGPFPATYGLIFWFSCPGGHCI